MEVCNFWNNTKFLWAKNKRITQLQSSGVVGKAGERERIAFRFSDWAGRSHGGPLLSGANHAAHVLCDSWAFVDYRAVILTFAVLSSLKRNQDHLISRGMTLVPELKTTYPHSVTLR